MENLKLDTWYPVWEEAIKSRINMLIERIEKEKFAFINTSNIAYLDFYDTYDEAKTKRDMSCKWQPIFKILVMDD